MREVISLRLWKQQCYRWQKYFTLAWWNVNERVIHSLSQIFLQFKMLCKFPLLHIQFTWSREHSLSKCHVSFSVTWVSVSRERLARDPVRLEKCPTQITHLAAAIHLNRYVIYNSKKICTQSFEQQGYPPTGGAYPPGGGGGYPPPAGGAFPPPGGYPGGPPGFGVPPGFNQPRKEPYTWCYV